MISRRVLLAGLAAPAIAHAAEPLTLVSPGGFGIDFMEAMNAVAGGHLARAGFAPVLEGANGQAPANAQVLAGQAAFTRSAALDLMLAAAGAVPPLVAVATLYQASTFHVISPADQPLADAASMAGKIIGVVSVRGTTELLLDLMLHQAGIPREAVQRVAVGNNPGALALVQQGRIAGFIASISVVTALATAPVLVWSTDRYAPLPSQCWVTTPKLIAQQPDLVHRFLAALRASCEELLTDPFPPLLDRMAASFEIPGIRDPARLAAVKEAITRLWLSQGRDTLLRNVPALWQQGADAVRSAGLAPVPDPAAFYTNALL